ncbi:MFS transporter [Sphingopyxis macrogoltabida]|uniref:MFS transporter n=1 Tax=Sphingopyxis macrogoltabida TaxID=33050 RepID=A0AAC9AWX6_SPHMC|nr:MFS transporter [Sphingopyxis macrogoltabida]ALJ15237.1 major facilitator transporter [Sphingopyxis macrogoltabida]AMU91482.1 MFS transporter [Sphingopyxis macrogoltabida]
MFAMILPVRSLLVAIFVMMAGSGFLSTLIGLRLERAGSGTIIIGIVATAYFGGLVLGALRAGEVVRRVGHIRAFAAFVALLSASTLTYALLQHPALWMALRFVDGLCVAGVFICVESWLNDRAEPATRGAVLAGYMVALYSGQALGQLILRSGNSAPQIPFELASILISLAIIPVCLTRATAPQLEDAASVPLRRLVEASPLGVAGAGVTGLLLGAFYGLAAIYARRIGLDLADTAAFMTTVILGGVALQWPLGRLSDRYDRRRVILACFAATWMISIALASQPQGILLFGLGAAFGGLSFALYPLCVAYANDRLLPAERVAASGQLVLVYSSGAALGPLGAAASMSMIGAGGLFLFIALASAVMFTFGIWRAAIRPPVPADRQQDFQILPRTTPVAALLDPAGPESAAASTEQPQQQVTHG